MPGMTTTTSFSPLITDELRRLSRRAADLIEEHGWTQHSDQAPDGRLISTGSWELGLTGGLRLAATQPGDHMIAQTVFTARGQHEWWNDERDRTKKQVLAALRSTDITEAVLADVFGPRWEAVMTVVRTAQSFTTNQLLTLIVKSRNKFRSDSAHRVAVLAAHQSGRDTTIGRALNVGDDAAHEAVHRAVSDSMFTSSPAIRDGSDLIAIPIRVRDAMAAATVGDLVGRYGYAQAHHNVLTGAWNTVTNPTG